MTTTVVLGWQVLPSPTVDGLGAMQCAGSRASGTRGVQQSADGSGLYVWRAGEMQYYDGNAGTWSASHTMQGGSANPGSWGPVYKNNALYYDKVAKTFIRLNMTSGEEYPLGKNFLGNLDCSKFTFKLKGSTYYFNDFGGASAPIWWHPKLPGHFTTGYHDIISTQSCLVLGAYLSGSQYPYFKALLYIGSGSNTIDFYAAANGGKVDGTPSTFADVAFLPGRLMTRPSISDPFAPAGDYCDLGTLWNPLNTLPTSFPIPWAGFQRAGVTESMFAMPQTDISAQGTIFTTPPSSFEAGLGVIMGSQALTVCGTNAYARAYTSGGSLTAVNYVPFDLPSQAFLLPVTVAPPSPLVTAEFGLFVINGVPHLLDSALRFYSLTLAQYDNIRHDLVNFMGYAKQ